MKTNEFFKLPAERNFTEHKMEFDAVEEITIDDETLKKEINNLIWMFAPKNMTIGEADDMACEFFGKFKAAQEKYPQ